MQAIRQAVDDRGWRPWLVVVLATGVVLQTWLWIRAVWIYRDQVELYTLGLALARDGDLLPFGKLATGDYPIPGVFLELLVGLPLLAWFDYRASTLVLLAFHLAAALVLAQLLKRDFGWRFATIYLAIFWLSPWRLFHSGFLWEVGYLLLPAALHLWCCRNLSDQKSPAISALLAATLLLTAQLHGSVMILVLASLLLLLRRRIQLHWGGAALGAALGSLPLLPTLIAVLRGAAPPTSAAPAAGLLVRLNSAEKGFFYWFRLSSLDLGRRFRQSLFCQQPGGGEEVPAPLLCHVVHLTEVLALASVVVSLVAGWWFLRRRQETPGDWYRAYALALLVALLVAALSSPVLIQGWHALIALPAACLPVALWVSTRWRTAGPWLRTIMLLFILWRIPASLLLLGHPMYTQPSDPNLPRHIVPQELQGLLPD